MTTTYHRTADGAQVPDTDALDARGCLKDGHTMRNKLLMMDGVPVERDTFVPLTDEQKSDAIDARNARLSDAWRNPTPLADTGATSQAAAYAGQRDTGDSYERYDKRVEDAWRQPAQ